jgi:hypothetical protein
VLPKLPAAQTTSVRLFFIGCGGRQIRSIDHRDTLEFRAQLFEQLDHKVIIDGTQSTHAGTSAKLVQHSRIGRALTV